MVPEVTFPLDSFRDAAPHLRRPFTAAAVKFKVQATWPKDKPTNGLIVAYIDARLAVERLNLIVPHLWHDDYTPLGTKHLICRLTVDGITRQDVGEGEGKGLYSDALKRAAVKFGVGVPLYAVPQMVLATRDSTLRSKTVNGKPSLELTVHGENVVRDLYTKWLTEHGEAAFGLALSHGDVEGAQGDVEAEGESVVNPETGEIAPVEVEFATDAAQNALKAAAAGLRPSKVKLVLGAHGITPGEGAATFFAFVPADVAETVADELRALPRAGAAA